MRRLVAPAAVVALALAAFVFIAAGAESKTAREGAAPQPALLDKPPNFLLIISDDQGWGDYGFMGHEQVRTPNLDRLAAESLVFRRGYVPSSLCCPSLASIITGQYAHQHKVTGNDPPKSVGFEAGREVMARHLEAVPTLPRLLAERGYVSLQTGKWWQGHYGRGGFTHGMTKGKRHGDQGLKIGRETLEPVYEFIDSAAGEGKPFFVWYAPMMPHTPHDPPERLLDYYRDKSPSLAVAKYWAMCEWFDETCGRLLHHLDRTGLAENTVVLYVTDNGWIQDPERDRYAPRSKQSPYDGGLRTPIMVRWPGKVTPREAEELASSIDLAPTILAVAGVETPEGMTGVSLLDQQAVAGRDAIFGECFTHDIVDLNDPASSLRWRWVIERGDGGRLWKLILPAPQNEPDARPELYELAGDPHEQTNRAAEESQRVGHLTRRLDEWWPVGN